MKNILENIKVIREKKNLSQENIADELGIAQNAYGLIENGKRKLTYERLAQIAIIFECSVIDIITYPKKYIDKDTVESPERISVTFEISKDKRDILLNLVTNKDN
jgi:transcriptional regulator with XRE-family HTH domain